VQSSVAAVQDVFIGIRSLNIPWGKDRTSWQVTRRSAFGRKPAPRCR